MTNAVKSALLALKPDGRRRKLEDDKVAARTIYEQTGWVGTMRVSICQDHKVLARVTDYDFNLKNKAFRRYCEKRGVLYRAGSGPWFEFTSDHSGTKERFFKDFRKALKDPKHPQYFFNDDELEDLWEIMLATKGAFQDCWELFVGRRLKPDHIH